MKAKTLPEVKHLHSMNSTVCCLQTVSVVVRTEVMICNQVVLEVYNIKNTFLRLCLNFELALNFEIRTMPYLCPQRTLFVFDP